MGYRSNVAFSFDEHNWKILCERAKTNKNALSEHNSFNDMLKYADINREVEFLEIKFYVLEWNNIESVTPRLKPGACSSVLQR